jgi:hypothetical protein
VEYAGRVAQLQDGYVNRFNLKSPLCPALHWFKIKSFGLFVCNPIQIHYTNNKAKDFKRVVHLQKNKRLVGTMQSFGRQIKDVNHVEIDST